MPKATPAPKPNPLNIFIVAEQFRYAGKFATLIPKLANDNPGWFDVARDIQMPQPSMVCAALSLELYFKCLIRMGNKSYKKRHDLEELFNLIGRGTRVKIKKYFYAHSEIVREHFEREYGKKKVSDIGLFKFCLTANRDAFRA